MSHSRFKFFNTAADLLRLAKEDGKNVKHLLYNDLKYKFVRIKPLYAIVSEALKHWEVLEVLINESKLLVEKPYLNIWRVRILITELIFGKKYLNTTLDDGSEYRLAHIVLSHEERFKELLCTKQVQKMLERCKTNETNVEVTVRFIKVNTIKADVTSVINRFTTEDWELLETADSNQGYLEQLRKLVPGCQQFIQDFHIPQVLVFPSDTELYWHELYSNGSIFFMDKSSCLAPFLLQPHAHSTMLDMCAAPGLKAIYLAGINQFGKLYAVERDKDRFQSLQKMVKCSGADNVVAIHNDVTKLPLDQYADVEYILLDPSCSGSGMRTRQPRISSETRTDDKTRLHKLAGFQLTLLRFALTRFPAAKRIVYSTCSVNMEENEEVVQGALNSSYHDFDIVSVGKKLPGWISFGSDNFDFGSKCIYSRPEKDFTNGFFVAVFERKKHYCKDISFETVDRNSKKTKNKIFKENHLEKIEEKKLKKNFKNNTQNLFEREEEICEENYLTVVGYDKSEITINYEPNKKRFSDVDNLYENHNKIFSDKKFKGGNNINCEKIVVQNNNKLEYEHQGSTEKKKAFGTKSKTVSLKKRMRQKNKKQKMLGSNDDKDMKKKKLKIIKKKINIINEMAHNDTRKLNGTSEKLEQAVSNITIKQKKISKAKLRQKRAKLIKCKQKEKSEHRADAKKLENKSKSSNHSQKPQDLSQENKIIKKHKKQKHEHSSQEITHESTSAQCNSERKNNDIRYTKDIMELEKFEENKIHVKVVKSKKSKNERTGNKTNEISNEDKISIEDVLSKHENKAVSSNNSNEEIESNNKKCKLMFCGDPCTILNQSIYKTEESEPLKKKRKKVCYENNVVSNGEEDTDPYKKKRKKFYENNIVSDVKKETAPLKKKKHTIT